MSAPFLQRFCDGSGAAAFCLLLACYHYCQSNVARAQLQIWRLTRLIPYLTSYLY